MRIGAIVQVNQLNIHKQLNRRPKKKHRRRDSAEHLSFSDIDRMMREKRDVNESKCIGR